MKRSSQLIGFGLSCLAVCACSKKEPLPDKRSAPWPAHEEPEAAPARSLVTRYAIDTKTATRFELKAPAKTLSGTLRVARGEIELHLLDLTRTRGTVEIDVASALIEDEDPVQARESTRRAHDWLEIGASRPEAERERLRWATFTLQALEKPSAEAAHEGQRVKAKDAGGQNPADPAGSGEAPASEVRAVSCTATGQLSLHGFRVDRKVDVRLLFFYPVPAVPGSRPERIVIQTRRPLVVSLKTHDIKPRNSMGVFLAQEAKLLGREIGSSAEVHLELAARPVP